MNYRMSFLLLAMASVLPVMAQHTENVHGTYTYRVAETEEITLAEARRRAIAEAKSSAIKDRFGELVATDIMSDLVVNNGQEMASFSENTELKAKGVWLSDTKPEKIDITYEAPYLIYNVEVWGVAREITQAQIDIDCKVLCHSKASGAEQPSVSFTHMDNLILKFKSPADGYIAVYLQGEDNNVYCLLPNRDNTSGYEEVKGGREYTFFGMDEPASKRLRVTTDKPSERNQLVVFFSPKRFYKSKDEKVDPKGKLPNRITSHDFQKWQLKTTRADEQMQMVKTDISIIRM